MAQLKTRHRVVGIDVGGSRKGFHAVALEDGIFLARRQTSCVEQLAGWCREEIGARLVGIDAPCRWSTNGRVRPAERELLAHGIRCFLTPTRRVAALHPRNYYEWMLRGAGLFRALEKTHPLCRAAPTGKAPCCFETFPHAITWHLRGGNARATEKKAQRLALLRQHGGYAPCLVNIDWVDAALCAVVAAMAAAGRPLKIYGEEHTGYILVPASPEPIGLA
jgi:predicted nuclease with RNAse H fold